MTTEVIVTIIIAFLGSNGLWALIQSIYNKKDKTQDKLDEKAKGVIIKGKKNW